MVWSDWDAGWWARGDSSGDALSSASEALSLALGHNLADEEQALASELQRLYGSEINVRLRYVSGRWSGTVQGQRKAVQEMSPSGMRLPAFLDWMMSAACRAFPDSAYAKRETHDRS